MIHLNVVGDYVARVGFSLLYDLCITAFYKGYWALWLKMTLLNTESFGHVINGMFFVAGSMVGWRIVSVGHHNFTFDEDNYWYDNIDDTLSPISSLFTVSTCVSYALNYAKFWASRGLCLIEFSNRLRFVTFYFDMSKSHLYCYPLSVPCWINQIKYLKEFAVLIHSTYIQSLIFEKNCKY